jgi:hypothetical protein
MQVAVETGGRFWLLKVGYDEWFARCSRVAAAAGDDPARGVTGLLV